MSLLPVGSTQEAVFVTGAAGFIGFHLTKRLNAMGVRVIGFDNVNDYYDVSLKRDRLRVLYFDECIIDINKKSEEDADDLFAKRLCHESQFWLSHTHSSEGFELQESVVDGVTYCSCPSRNPNFLFVEGSLEDSELVAKIFSSNKFKVVVHLAAQAGVRYSITNPSAYIQSNLVGFFHMLENSRKYAIEHLLYASSSSVYGGNTKVPFSEDDSVDHPVSLYAATKKCNELMAHSYSHLFQIPVTGLRFFTVYGEYGRPDMAPAIFANCILRGKEMELFNHGAMKRDFTYVADVVESIVRLMPTKPSAVPTLDGFAPSGSTSTTAPYRVYNIGNSNSVELLTFVSTLEKVLGQEGVKVMKDMQPGDVLMTAADTRLLEEAIGFVPGTPLESGLRHFGTWYRTYYSR